MAGNRKTKRIFLICQDDINSKTCSKTVKFRDTDEIYILIKKESLKLPEGLLDYFNNKEKALSLKSEALVEHLRSTRESDKNVYYFIGPGAKELYHEIGSDVMLFSKGIAYNDTFGMSKVPIEKPTQSEITDLESSFHFVSESLSMALEENISPNSAYDLKPKEDKQKKTDLIRDSGGTQNVIPAETIETFSQIEKKNTKANGKDVIDQKKENQIKTESVKNPDSVVCEKDITNGKEEPVRIESHIEEEKEISISERCMRTKATVVSCLFERFQEHLKIYTKREMEQETCFQFLQLLLKAKSPEDFTISWKCQEPDSGISLSMEQFLDLKGEALYWYDISNLFYKGDLWNY